MFIEVDDLVVPHLEEHMKSNTDFDTAALSSACHMDRGDHRVALVGDLLETGSYFVPGVKPCVPDPHSTLYAVGGSVVVLKREPLDLGMNGVPEGVTIFREGLQPLLHEFHVLLRHRL